jgi:hypothetical protein
MALIRIVQFLKMLNIMSWSINIKYQALKIVSNNKKFLMKLQNRFF